MSMCVDDTVMMMILLDFGVVIIRCNVWVVIIERVVPFVIVTNATRLLQLVLSTRHCNLIGGHCRSMLLLTGRVHLLMIEQRCCDGKDLLLGVLINDLMQRYVNSIGKDV